MKISRLVPISTTSQLDRMADEVDFDVRKMNDKEITDIVLMANRLGREGKRVVGLRKIAGAPQVWMERSIELVIEVEDVK